MTPRSRRERQVVILLPAARFATPSFVFADPIARSAVNAWKLESQRDANHQITKSPDHQILAAATAL
jgi:hypothetical protein